MFSSEGQISLEYTEYGRQGFQDHDLLFQGTGGVPFEILCIWQCNFVVSGAIFYLKDTLGNYLKSLGVATGQISTQDPQRS